MSSGYTSVAIPLGTGNGWVWYHRRSRSWNGADSPRLPPRAKQYQTITVPERFTLSGKLLPAFSYNKRIFGDTPARGRKLSENNYSMEFAERKEGYRNYNYGYTFGYSSVAQEAGPDLTYDPWSANDDIALIGKLREKIMGASFNASVTAAEMPRAIEMIADSATRIRKAFTSAKHGNVKAAWNFLTAGTERAGKLLPSKTDASNFYLQAQYGWKPLLADTGACAQYIAHQMYIPREEVVVVTRFAGGRNKGFPISDKPMLNVIPRLDVYCQRDVSSSKRIRAIIKDVDMPSLSGFADYQQAAWEFLPWSFVADWFMPVGQYLQALTFSRSISATYVITKRRYLHHHKMVHVLQPGNNPSLLWWWNEPKEWFSDIVTFSRTVTGYLPVPLPEMKPPITGNDMTRAYNAIALLVQLHGSGSKKASVPRFEFADKFKPR